MLNAILLGRDKRVAVGAGIERNVPAGLIRNDAGSFWSKMLDTPGKDSAMSGTAGANAEEQFGSATPPKLLANRGDGAICRFSTKFEGTESDAPAAPDSATSHSVVSQSSSSSTVFVDTSGRVVKGSTPMEKVMGAEGRSKSWRLDGEYQKKTDEHFKLMFY